MRDSVCQSQTISGSHLENRSLVGGLIVPANACFRGYEALSLLKFRTGLRFQSFLDGCFDIQFTYERASECGIDFVPSRRIGDRFTSRITDLERIDCDAV